MKRFIGSSVVISLGAAAYMIYVFIDFAFLTIPDGETDQSLVDKFFPIVFLIVGLYMLRVSWDQYSAHRDGKLSTRSASATEAKAGQSAKNDTESE